MDDRRRRGGDGAEPEILTPEGTLILAFRDYVSAPLQGGQRFIPVRNDADRILTCFLEYEERRVVVTDLIHDRSGDEWRQRASSYFKLRLDPVWLASRLAVAGLEVVRQTTERGMVTVVARRPGLGNGS